MLCDYVRYNLRNHLDDKLLAQSLGHMGDGFRDYFGIKFTVVPAQGSQSAAGSGEAQADSVHTVSAETPGVERNSTQTPVIESAGAEAPVSEASDAQPGSTTSGDNQTSAAETGAAQAPATKMRAEVVPAPDRNGSFLLSDTELARLETIVAGLPTIKRWQASRPVHETHKLCTGEINRRLSPIDADRWAKKSRRFVRQLERKRLSLEVGIGIVREWVDQLRGCLGAMDETALLPAPHGGFPTPANPKPGRPNQAPPVTRTGHGSKKDDLPPSSPTEEERLEPYIKRMLATIERLGPKTKAKTLIGKGGAKMGKSTGYTVLRILEKQGLYELGKSKSVRYEKDDQT
jgi:hypothetical protein